MINLKLIGTIVEAAAVGVAIGMVIADHEKVKAVDTMIDIQKNHPDEVHLLNDNGEELDTGEAEKASKSVHGRNKFIIAYLALGYSVNTYGYFKYGFQLYGNITNPINLAVAVASCIGAYIHLAKKNRKRIQSAYYLKEVYGDE